MEILELEIQGFGNLQNRPIQFNPDGLNLIIGPNESGKSTLCHAISAIIFGISSHTYDWRAWSGNDEFCGSIILKDGQRLIKIYRDFSNHNTTLTIQSAGSEEVIFSGRANPRGRTDEALAYQLSLQSLGFPPEAVFRSSGYIGQLNVETQIDEELRKQISGAGQGDYLYAIQVLQEHYYSLTRLALPGEANKREARKIELLSSDIYQLNNQLIQSEGILSKLIEAQTNHEEAQATLSSIQEKMKGLESQAKALENYRDLVITRQYLTQQQGLQESHSQQIIRLEDNIREIQMTLRGERISFLADLPEITLSSIETYSQSNAEQLLFSISNFHNQEEKIRQELSDSRYLGFSDAQSDTKQLLETLIDSKNTMVLYEPGLNATLLSEKKDSSRSFTLALAIGMAIAGAILGAFLVPEQRILGLGFGTLIMVGLGVIIYQRRTLLFHQKEQQKNQLLDEQKTRYRIAEESYDSAHLRLQSFLDAVGDDVTFEVLLERLKIFIEKQEELNNLCEKRRELEAQPILAIRNDPELSKILATESLAVLKERIGFLREQRVNLKVKQDALANIKEGSDSSMIPSAELNRRLRDNLTALERLEEDRPTLTSFRDNPDELLGKLEKVKQEIQTIDQQKTQSDSAERRIQIELGTLQSTFTRDPLSIQEEIQVKQEELNRLVRRKDALYFANNTLKEAIQEYEKGHLTRLSELTSSYFRRLTSERYKSVGIRIGAKPEIFTSEGHTISPSSLSQGARDQLYFSLRLAILDLIASGARMPIILDDTFVNYDGRRLAVAQQTIEKVAQDRQVILLSFNTSYLNWHGTVVNI
jgi:DNA repair exonuclease SbcCD ATPase subunit